MMDRRFLESFLRLNKVPATASTAEVRTVLTQARWPQEQIKEALLVYNTDSGISQALTHNQPFRPDMDWSSSKLSALLGIDVVVDPQAFQAPLTTKMKVEDMGKKIFLTISITLISVIIAGSIGMGLMYLFEVGPFHKHVESII